MVNLSTSGPGAAHAFNALPNHPSLEKIKDPGSEQKINDELIQPGKDIAAKKLPLAQCVKLFDKQMTQIMNSWGDSEAGILTDALAKRPTEEMTPKELKDHIDAALADFKKEQARWRLEQWKEEQESDGKTVSAEDLEKQKQELKDQVDGWCDEEAKQIIRDVIEVPQVVIADTNWGGAKDQTLFVIAPDPISGELMMWRKEKFSGKMEPAGEEWTNASWSVLKDKTPPPPPTS